MFLRQTRRKKDGKTHTYWSVVENQRLQGGRVVQRHVLDLGEISPSQAAAWRKSIEVFDEDTGHPRTLALFPEDRATVVTPDSSTVQLRLSEMRLQWGACWLAGQLWEELRLDRFWSERLPAPVMIFCWRTKRICSRTWWHAGETCSTLTSMCCSTI